MSQMDIKVEEYKSLRSSIDMHLKLILEILAFMVAATSALLGYGFGSSVSLVFLTPLPIILSCVYLIRTQMEEVLRKGAYIMVKYEIDYIGWESTLYELRSSKEDKQEDKKSPWLVQVLTKVLERIIPTWKKASTDSRAIFLIAMVLISICIGCFSYFYISYFPLNKFSFIIIIVIFILFLMSFCYFSYCMVLRSVLEAYTYEKEEDYVKEFNKGVLHK